MNINKEIEELQIKATKYDNLKGRYVEHATELDRIIKDLQKLRADIDPVLNLYIGSKNNITLKDKRIEMLSMMYKGTEVTRDLILRTFPTLTTIQASQMMIALQKEKRVMKRKEGVKVILFVQKDL